jgi:ABC-type dipeptide/oligopeptide/nickel transport system ATPase component
MTTAPPLVEIRGLRTHFFTESGVARAVDDVSLDIRQGEVMGLVGESGSGKSVTALSILRLIPDPPGRIVGGEILYQGRDLLKLPLEEVRQIRGSGISMVFQEPMTSLNPVFTIGTQLTEVILAHEACSREEAIQRSVAMLAEVGIPDAGSRMAQYPHHLSGGCASAS